MTWREPGMTTRPAELQDCLVTRVSSTSMVRAKAQEWKDPLSHVLQSHCMIRKGGSTLDALSRV